MHGDVIAAPGHHADPVPAGPRLHLDGTTHHGRYVDALCREAACRLEADPSLLAAARAAALREPNEWTDTWLGLLEEGAHLVASLLRSTADGSRALRAASPVLQVAGIDLEQRAEIFERSA